MSVFRISVALLATALLVSCAQRAVPPPLRVGFSTWPGYELIYLAHVKGFYEQQGVAVKLVQLNSLTDVRRAFERGQIEVMAATMVEVLIAAQHTGRALNLIAVCDASAGGDMLFANRAITDVAGLRGKRVGMEGATVDVYAADAVLRSVGLDLGDVVVVSKAQEDLMVDLDLGEIDAVQTYPPYAVRLAKSGRYNKIFDSSKIPGQIVDVLAVDTEVLAHRREDLRRFLRAYFQAFDYFQAEPHEFGAIAGPREGISGAEFLEALRGMEVFGREHQLSYLSPDDVGGQTLRRVGEALVATAWLEEPAEVSAFFDPNPGDLLH